VSVEIETAGDACVVTVDRPTTKNALDAATATRLGEAIESAAREPSVRGIVLAATGDTFLSGGDLNELARLSPNAEGAASVLAMFEAVRPIEECDVPVIAAIQGDVYGGGCELLLLCDLAIAEEQARFAFRHVAMGLSPAWGGLARLVERTGPIEAARLLFTAERIDAKEALRIGLVNEVVPRGEARRRAIERVETIAKNPKASVASLKKTLHAARAMGRRETSEIEQRAFVDRWGGPDHQNAMRAFAAKKRG
jgi:enoyl-CoA hydratase/carnithine racemase